MTTVNLTEANFAETITTNPIMLVDFWASWCGPCRAFAPVFERSAAKRPDVVHAKVDTDAEYELAAADIQSIPTIMAFRDSVLLLQEPGAMSPVVLDDLIRQLKSVDMSTVRAEIAAADAAVEATNRLHHRHKEFSCVTRFNAPAAARPAGAAAASTSTA